jgi:dihydrofolate reductase
MVEKTRIVFYPAISLDGFIAKADGDSDWVTPEDELLFAEEVRRSGCVIVGRRTFEQYDGKIYPIQGAMTFVCTARHQALQANPRPGVTYVGGEVQEIIREIEAAGFTSAVLSGGGDTNGRFAEARAINEMIVSFYPHIIGSGVSLFGGRRVQLNLELLETRKLGSGVVRNRYAVAV